MITYDSAGVGAFAAGGTTATWQHVIGTSATALLVAMSFSGGSPNTASRTVKVGNKTLTSLGVLQSSPTAWTELFGILGPSTGAQTVNVTTSVPVAKTGNSVAYRGVTGFDSTFLNLPSAGSFTVTQPVTRGGWLVAAFGVASAVSLRAISGTLRYQAASTPTVAIVDDVSPDTSVTLSLSSAQPTTASAAAVSVYLVPVIGSTGISQTGSSSLPTTATATASASVTSVRFADAPLAVTASATATATAIGSRFSSSTLITTATATASASVSLHANADINIVTTPTADREKTLWIFNSSLAATATRTATATVTLAVIPPPAAHSPLRYVGRYPDTEGSVSPRSYAIAANTKTNITTESIDKIIDSLINPLTKVSYVDQQDATKALKTAVTDADELYFPATGHGLAVLDADGYVTANQIPALSASRPSECYVGSVGSGTATTSSNRSVLLGTVTIPDLGYPYVVLPFAWVTGSNYTGTLKSRWAGTGNTAKLAVMPTTGGENICGWGICAGSQKPSLYPVTPTVAMGVASQKYSGGITLGLYGSLLAEASGRSYTFSGGTSSAFYVITLPAV